MYELMLCLSKF